MRGGVAGALCVAALLAARPAQGQDLPSTEEVVVQGLHRDRAPTDISVPAPQASKVAGTEGDPVKVLENLPGMARAAFGSGQLIVWGAAPQETRTFIDGVEVPSLFHGSGLRSVINGDLVRSVTLTPGAYGAEYGRGLGGIVRVETKDLPERGVGGYAAADTLDGSGMLTAAFGDRLRVGVAARYGWIKDVLQAVDTPDVSRFFAIPSYGDYQAKAQIALRDRETLDAVVLGATDDLSLTNPDADPGRASTQTTSTTFQRVYLHYRHLVDDGATVDAVAYGGHDTSRFDEAFGATDARLYTETWRAGLRASHYSRVSKSISLTWGADLDGTSTDVFRTGSMLIPPREGDISVFGQPPGSDTNTDSWTASVVDVAPYVIGSLEVGPLQVSPALRADGYLLQTSRQTPKVGETPSLGYEQLSGELEPRISARLRVGPRLTLLGAAGLYSQPPDPRDLSAVFGNPKLGPASADHVSVGESLHIAGDTSLDVTGFYRWMSGLAVRDPSPTPKLAEALLDEGVGRAYGVQLMLRQQPWHGFFGWVAYTISRSERRDTPTSGWRLFDYDQPHVLTAVASWVHGPWTVGARFRYATGFPRTPVTGSFYDAKDDLYDPIFGAQNTIRLPDFWQLDLRVDRSFVVGKASRLLVYVEGLNVTNHANAEEYAYDATYSRRVAITGLPAIAVIGARVEL